MGSGKQSVPHFPKRESPEQSVTAKRFIMTSLEVNGLKQKKKNPLRKEKSAMYMFGGGGKEEDKGNGCCTFIGISYDRAFRNRCNRGPISAEAIKL